MKNTILALSILASFSALASDDEIKSKKNDSYLSVSIGTQESQGIDRLNSALSNGVNYKDIEFSGAFDDSAPVLKIAYGSNFNEHFGSQVMVQYSEYDGTMTATQHYGYGYSYSYSHNMNVNVSFLNFGSYLVGRIPAENFSLFAKAGLVGTKFEVEAANISKSDTSLGFGYGVGADYSINDDWKMLVEYEVIEPNHKVRGNELTSISIGVARYF